MQLQTHPAGWYADPTVRHEARYWDGTRWTERIADHGVEGRDGLAGTVPADASGAAAAPGPLPVAGWYADPALRHEARYWDGTTWTERVADHGREVLDSSRAAAPPAPTAPAAAPTAPAAAVRDEPAVAAALRAEPFVAEAAVADVVITEPAVAPPAVAPPAVAPPAATDAFFDSGVSGLDPGTTDLTGAAAAATVYASEWYPDPTGRHELRYFDGTTWTEHVANEGMTAVDALVDGSPGVAEPADPFDEMLASMAAPDDSNLAMTVTGETVTTGVAAIPPTETAPASDETPETPKRRFTAGVMAGLGDKLAERLGAMPKSQPAGVVGWIVVSGAALLGLGSLGPWAKASAPYVGEVAQSGTAGDGKFILVMAFLLAILGIGLVVGRLGRIVALGAVGLGTLAAIVCAVDMARISNGNYGLLQGVGNVTYSTGIGLWACLVGALVAIVGGIVAVTQR